MKKNNFHNVKLIVLFHYMKKKDFFESMLKIYKWIFLEYFWKTESRNWV